MKLIDSSEFIKNLALDTSKGFYGEFMDGSEIAYTSREIDAAVENAPTIDAVLVVRCRECRHWLPRQGCSGCHHRSGLWEPREDDYCSHGERKEADHD